MASMEPVEPSAPAPASAASAPAQDPARPPVRVAIVVFRECDPSIVYGVYDTLWAAGWIWDHTRRSQAAHALFRPRLVAAEAGPIELVSGVTILAQDAAADVAAADVVFVPNVLVYGPDDMRALDRRLIDWIRRMHRQGTQLFAACGGSLVLAEAGVLDGCQATTHWTYVPLFRALYPAVALHPERILVQGGPGHSVACAGGASSWQDLVLLLIARHAGTDEAIRISKVFLYQWHRDGQLPYASMAANVDHGDAVIRDAQAWIARHYAADAIIAALVRRAGLPKRTFDRRFRAATGYAPLAYVQALRVEEAKQMLERGNAPVDAIAREVGYEDAASFRRLFRRLAGMTPGAYRRTFQLPRFVAAAAAAAGSGTGNAPPRRTAQRRG